MKKVLILILALSFCLAGCGSNETNETKSVFTTQQIQTTEAPTTQAEIKKFDQTVSDSFGKMHFKMPDGIEKTVDGDDAYFYADGGMVMIEKSDTVVSRYGSLESYLDEYVNGMIESGSFSVSQKSVVKIDQYDAFNIQGTLDVNGETLNYITDCIILSDSMYVVMVGYYNGNEEYFLELRNMILTSMYFDETEETTEVVTEVPKETTESEAPEGEPTLGEKNALQSAKSYLDYSAFSAKGLKEQLEFEGYSSDEAQYAVDHCGADWMEQAALSAKQYMDYSSFSRQALIEQLEFEGFTHEQAEHGAEAVGY